MRTADKTNTIHVPTSSIKEGSRVRADYGNLKELAESIRLNGLIHPVVIDLEYNLVAGGRRFRAIRDILQLDEVPVTFFEVADEATLRQLEAEENVRRKELTWQERVLSIKLVHDKSVLTSALKSQRWTMTHTGSLINQSQASVSYALTIAERINAGDQEIIKCANLTEALKVLIKRKEDEANAALSRSSVGSGVKTQDITALLADARRGDTGLFAEAASALGPGPAVLLSGRPDTPELPGSVVVPEVVVPLSSMMHNTDSIAFMQSLPPESFDHIITDAPYAIDMDMIQQDGGGMNIDSTRAEHDVTSNQELLRRYLQEAYRSVRDRGFVITWCDISQWQYLCDIATSNSFVVQRWPLLWHKTHTCQNMAATYNFTKTYELALVLRKPNATLLSPQSSAIWQGTFDLNEKESYGHPFAKPAKLWQWLYAAVAQRGQSVLDCFAGSGSSTVAAIRSGVRPISVELKPEHYHRAVVNVTNEYRRLHPKVTFT